MTNSADPNTRRKAFTLVEVAVGMAVFIILLVSGSIAVTQTQKMAYSNVMHNTARTVMEGYMEQMKGIAYGKYVTAMSDTVNIPLETKGISALKTGPDITYDDPLFIGVENKKEVLLDIRENKDGTQNPSTMDMFITPTLTHLVSLEGLNAYEITLAFRYKSLFQGVTKEYNNSIRFLKTSISEY